jgi:hypothetical protein
MWYLMMGWNPSWTRAQHAAAADVSTRELQRWVHAFNENGMDGLRWHEAKRRGRKRIISNPIWHTKIRPYIEKMYGPVIDEFSFAQFEQLHHFVTVELGLQVKHSYLIKRLRSFGIRIEASPTGSISTESLPDPNIEGIPPRETR